MRDRRTTGSKSDNYPIWRRTVKDLVIIAAPLLAVCLILTYVIFLSVVQTGSMEPTLGVGNTVFYNRLAYIDNTPQRGDIVAFKSDEYGVYFGKRIIGLPGDEISFDGGRVVINGRYCDESAYLPANVETNCAKTFTVPDGCCFLLGDNRENSNDSRFWTDPYISFDKIKGRYLWQIDFSFQFDVFGSGHSRK